MNGLKKSSNQSPVDEYLRTHDIYKSSVSNYAPFDLRGFASFIRKNSLKNSDITPEIEKQFIIKRG